MNIIFFFMILIAFLFAAGQQFAGILVGGEIEPMEALSKAIVDSASGSVELAIGLAGVMTLFLGLMKVAEAGGILNILSRLIRPLMERLFPDVPPEHPAMGAMILNFSANALGLGNAATPFGIRAIQELDKLNSQPGTATNSMALFLAINTSGITLLPTGVIALRAAAGSSDPAAILPTTLFATIGSTITAISAAFVYQRFFPIKNSEKSVAEKTLPENLKEKSDSDVVAKPYPLWVSISSIFILVALVPFTIVYGKAISSWIIPGLAVGFLSFGIFKKVRIYEEFVEGAKEGFQVAVRIIPYLVAILVAVGMLNASGAIDMMTSFSGVLTSKFKLPAEALLMAFMRPLSGSGAYGLMASIINDPAIGPDSYTGYLVTTLQGSTETTFYVLAVYFGAVNVRRIRHTLATALTADVAGVVFAVIACACLFS